MTMLVRNSAILLALAASSSVVSAQSTITTTTTTETHRGVFSPEQRTTIYRTITSERRAAPVPHAPVAEYRVGAPIPQDVELYDFPEDAYVDIPPLREHRYVYVNNRLVVVDSRTSRVVDVISE